MLSLLIYNLYMTVAYLFDWTEEDLTISFEF